LGDRFGGDGGVFGLTETIELQRVFRAAEGGDFLISPRPDVAPVRPDQAVFVADRAVGAVEAYGDRVVHLVAGGQAAEELDVAFFQFRVVVAVQDRRELGRDFEIPRRDGYVED